MFAPPVVKPQTKAAASPTSKPTRQCATLMGPRFGGGAVEQLPMLQWSIGNQATPRFFAQHAASLLGNNRAAHAAPGASWDFTKIPGFPPEQEDIPLKYEAKPVSNQAMRMPDPAIPSA